MVDTASLLERAPDWARRAVAETVAGRGLLGRLADTIRFRYKASELPQLPAVSEHKIRLLIGPANEAGQGYEWARAVERHFPGAAAIAMRGIGIDPFQPKVDLLAPVGVYQRSAAWHADFETFLARHTHVIWESGFPLLGRRFGSDVIREVTQLARHGVKGALLFHGSDIRPPARHAHHNPWSPFHDSRGPVRALADVAARNAELVSNAGVPVFVSTPDQLQWVPQATWCPVVVETARWRSVAAVRPARERLPVVVHAPSNTWLKGTDRIEPMLRKLADEGILEYRQILGVPHSAMPDFYANADIVLDQFRVGSYGVAACEAMASGRLVMCHVDESTRQTVKTATGLDLPLHEATLESLEAELRRAIADPSVFEELRAAGPLFVDAVHDGRLSAEALAPFLGLSA